MQIVPNHEQHVLDRLPVIRFLWSQGLDTLEIAKRLSVPEHVIYNLFRVKPQF